MFVTQHLRNPRRDRAILGAALAALAALAWVSLALWSASPWGRYLGHDASAGGASVGGASLATGSLGGILEVSLFAAGWVLMIVAMMLPSSLPLVLIFAGVVRRRPNPRVLVGFLLAGYLAIWTGFGVAAWVLDRGIHAAVDNLPWLAEHPQLIIGSTLLVAGLWQFSPIRDRCLDECRSPFGFVVNRWRGLALRRESFAMGIAHGAFCVGCCWSLMLVMFGVGLGSLPAMLGLGALTAIEKNLPWGRRLTHPVGFVLILAAVYAVAS
jgi:predicted metal-binding membrane protein